ncbi:MAG: PAS domain-containing protein [Methylobacter sp.]
MIQQNIVLIDPNPVNRQTNSLILRGAGFSVLEAESSEQAYAILASWQPAVAVLSLRLPNFYELFRHWQDDPTTATIPCLLLGPPDLPGDFPKHDADGYLAEPFTDVELSAYARVLLRLAESRYACTQVQSKQEESVRLGQELENRQQKLRTDAERLTTVLEAQRTITAANVDHSGLLRLILDIMSRLTEAEGGSLEMAEGDELVYEAATGLAEQFVGLRLNMAGSLSGLSLTTGELLRADDTETDPRVDRNACRKIGLRSMMVIPLHYDCHTFGVLKIMSSRPAAFDANVEHTLRLMAEFLGAVIARKRIENALRASEEALRESEERLRFALETSHTGAWDLNLLDHSAFRSLEHDRIFGYQQLLPEWTYEMFLDHVLPEDRASVDAKFRSAMSTGHDWNFECRICRADGEVRWIWAAGRHRANEAKVSQRMAGIVQDITERKQAEQALRESEARLRLATEVAKIGAFDWNIETGVNTWTPELETIYGLAPGEFGRTQTSWERLIHPDDRAGAVAKVEETLATGEPVEHEWRIVWPDGSMHWIGARFQCFKNTAGKPLHLRGVNIDITERKQTELALRQQAQLIDLSFEPIFVWDMVTGIVEWNRGSQELYGYSRSETLGHSSHNLLKTQHPIPFAEFETQLLTSRNWSGELRHTAKDGHQVIVESRQQLLEFNGRRLVLETNRDITERKATETALRESEYRFRKVTESLPQLIWTCKADGPCDYLSPQWLRYTGKSEAEQLGYGWLDQLYPEDRQRVIDQWQATAAKGEHFEIEFRIRRHDGAYRWFRTLAVPLHDDTGKIVKWYGSNTDIDDIKQGELALRESRRQLVMALEAGQLGFWDWDISSGRVHYGGRWAAMLGYDVDEVEPHVSAWEKLVHPDDKSAVTAALSEHLEGRTEFYECEHRLRHKNGSWRWILDRGQVVERDAEGRPIRAIGTHSDVTARREAVNALHEADRRKDEFLATLAHELRNPLAPISNGLHILQMPGVGSGTAEDIHKMMERQIKHLVRLVDDLMEVSRITRGKIELRKERIDLAEVLQCAIETSRPIINAARHQLDIELSAEPFFLEADKIRLAQVFANLLNNAAKYTPEGGRIWLSTRREDSNVLISVRDNGIGIPADMLPKVFDLFTQVGRTYNRAQSGLGIGLTLVQHLVKLHGGSVETKSEGVGKGSEFIVRLPLIESSSPHGGDMDNKQSETIAPQRILVVDDNRDIADSLALLLRQLGAEVVTANDGRSALEILQTFRPAVVLLDIGMPDMDGFEVARRIRQRPEGRDITLIALTGWGQEQDRRQSQDAGINYHLVKPVDLEILKELLT